MSNPLSLAVHAAREAGAMIRENFERVLEVNEMAAHDIKLELDVQCQDRISGLILEAFPDHAIYGEEGIGGNQSSPHQWIVDPIDGTVNLFYGIPHFCVSIALRSEGTIVAGVIYDPMRDELWSIERGGKPQLNGREIHVSSRKDIGECVLSVGFAKTQSSIDRGLPLFSRMVYRARKCRTMGSAALDMAYIACGRIDAYIEEVISLWDVAAGWLLIEAAGGNVVLTPRDDLADKYSIVAWNGALPIQEEIARKE
jgi:myo-inositol-1(or 4)-monophosphatase